MAEFLRTSKQYLPGYPSCSKNLPCKITSAILRHSYGRKNWKKNYKKKKTSEQIMTVRESVKAYSKSTYPTISSRTENHFLTHTFCFSSKDFKPFHFPRCFQNYTKIQDSLIPELLQNSLNPSFIPCSLASHVVFFPTHFYC